ncbi:MAG TPA: hypothetical protein VMN60_04525 [Longimicrobiales bacterium]|nr:hypothetical protein [Longimicrobiales bacterium]
MTEQSGGAAQTAGLSLEFVAKSTLIVLVLWTLAHGIWMARDILFITFFALLIASFLSIFVEPLHARGVRRSIATPAAIFRSILPQYSSVFVTQQRCVSFSRSGRRMPVAGAW